MERTFDWKVGASEDSNWWNELLIERLQVEMEEKTHHHVRGPELGEMKVSGAHSDSSLFLFSS